MCGSHYERVFAVLGTKKKRESSYYKPLKSVHPHPLEVGVPTALQDVRIDLKRHHPARGRVGAGWRPRSGFNNAVLSMAGSL